MKDAVFKGINAIVIERYQNRSNETLRKTKVFFKGGETKALQCFLFYSHDYN